MNQKYLAWLRVLRLPNVLTVPGDLWVGMALAGGVAGGREGVGMLLAVCFLYLAGMAQNAWIDRNRDAELAPSRPLPAGELESDQVFVVTRILFNLGIAAGLIAGLWQILFLAASVWLYNHLKDSVQVLGCLLMGICRGLVIWIGAETAGAVTPLVWGAAGVWTLYIAFVTALAKREHGAGPIKPHHIGWLLRCLFVMQAGVLVMAGEPVISGVVLAFALLHFLAGRKIAAS